ncbi:MAG: hypothetical protein AAGA46_17210, partial [Cyanobacteria bacterium P01_F01_bin.13]
ELETRATTAEGKVKGFEKTAKFTKAADKSGANAAVLERLLGDKADDIEISDDGTVKVGDKPLKEYVEADDNLKPFMASLFPAGGDNKGAPPKKKTDLPGGPPSNGNGDKGTNPLAQHLARHRGGAKDLVKTT